MIERVVRNDEVVGLIPIRSTMLRLSVAKAKHALRSSKSVARAGPTTDEATHGAASGEYALRSTLGDVSGVAPAKPEARLIRLRIRLRMARPCWKTCSAKGVGAAFLGVFERYDAAACACNWLHYPAFAGAGGDVAMPAQHAAGALAPDLL